jgi:hypothetical protein
MYELMIAQLMGKSVVPKVEKSMAKIVVKTRKVVRK